MDITLKNQQGLDATLHIQIEPADYQAEFDKKVDEYRKKSTFPGFRTGKAPVGMVKKMIGSDVRHDVIEHMLQHKIQDYLKDNNIKPLLNPIANYKHGDIDWTKESFEFSYDLGIRPEVNIDYNALGKIPLHDISIEDADLDKEITLARRQHGKADTAESFTDEPGVMAYVRFTEVGDDGAPLEDGVSQTKLLGNTEMPAKLKDLLLGKEKDFKQEANIHDLMTDDEIREHLEVDEKVAKDLDKMQIELVNVFKLDEAPLDQEFFDRYFEPGTISDEAAFREEFRKLMAGYLNREAESQWITKMKDQLVENTEVEYPEGLLKRYLLMTYDKENESEIEDFATKLEEFRQELKWMILSDFVAEQENIEVTEDDILNYTIQMLSNEFVKMGADVPDAEQLRQYGINYLSRENNYTRTSLALRDGKVFDALLAKAAPVKEKIKKSDFDSQRNKA